MNYNFKNMLDSENLTIDNILIDYGIFDTIGISKLIYSVLNNYTGKGDYTLLEFYNKTKIKLNVKVFNSTRSQVQYLSYENTPNISLLKLVQMTTAIPLFFKPVKYNDELYVDGGMRGHFPIEICDSGNYLGVFITGGTVNYESSIIKLFPILEYFYSLIISQDQIIYDIKNNKKDKRIIFNKVDYGLNFDMPNEDKLKIIDIAYNNTMNHIKQHLETNTI